MRMYIHEAVKAAIENDCYISTEEFKGLFKIKPTRTGMGCIACNPADGVPIIPRWQPTADELMRDDYFLVP